MSNKCWICLESSLLATEITTTSGKPIVDIIKSVLTSKSEENSEFSIVCQLCFEVIDEIDVFEQSLLRSKQKLEDRHCDSKNTADDKAVKPSPEHESFVSVIDPNQSKDLEYETEAPKKKRIKAEEEDQKGIYWLFLKACCYCRKEIPLMVIACYRSIFFPSTPSRLKSKNTTLCTLFENYSK